MRGSVSEREQASPAGDLEPPRAEASPRWPLVVVGIVILFNLVVLRAEARPVQNLNDASVHRSMIAWASERVEDGHLPLDGWYPDLALGSSRFHHYQSLPHVLTESRRGLKGSLCAPPAVRQMMPVICGFYSLNQSHRVAPAGSRSRSGRSTQSTSAGTRGSRHAFAISSRLPGQVDSKSVRPPPHVPAVDFGNG
jgi:hypothetical protein